MKVKRFLKKKRNYLKKKACNELSKRLFKEKNISIKGLKITDKDIDSDLNKK